jgi:hypothetical protein
MSRHFTISGQFILSVGSFLAVIVSFAAAAALVGPGGHFVFIILLFLLFFAVLFVPLSLLTRPLIERDVLSVYLDGVERRLKGWSFGQEDLDGLKRLEALLTRKKGRRRGPTLVRVAFLISEMERLEQARTSFFWEDSEGTVH